MAYSYERNYILALCASVREELEPLVRDQLSEKSSCRLAFLFDQLATSTVMDALFRPEQSSLLKQLATDLEVLLDIGAI